MNFKKIIGFVTTAALCTAMLAGCGQTGTTSSVNSETQGQQTSVSEKPKIGVVQIVEHKSLNTIRDSFTEKLAELGYKDGENCEVEYKSAQGEQNTLNSIIQSFSGDQKDVIVAIATPTAQAAALVSEDIPVVFSAVSDPVGAGLMSDLQKPDKNITGTCDAIQIDQIMDLMLKVDPDLKKLGVIYNLGEANSVSNIEKVKEIAKTKNIEVVEKTVTNISEVQQAAQVLASQVEAIFSPNDNTVASAIAPLCEAANKEKIPFYTGADSMVEDGGFATVGIDYTDLGKETAVMVDEVLKGKSPNDIPVKVFDTDLSTYINQKTLDTIGITLPDEVKNGENTVFVGNE